MPASLPPARILVVDDDEGFVTLITEMLREEGCDALGARSGEAAREALEKHPPDLMLLDLKMGGLGGQALVKRLRRDDVLVPFIVITGQGDEKVAVELMKQGALDYVVKDGGLLELLPAIVRKALEQIARDRALADARAALLASEREVLAISDHEQRRIGQDLHDGLGQQLTAIELMCQSLRHELAARQPDLEAQAGQICRYLREAIAQTRALSHGLAPVKLEANGLEEALGDLARLANASGRVKCRFRCPAPVPVADVKTAHHLFRIAQEAVNNALRHAQPSAIEIELARKNGSLRLRVSDDGCGFPPAPAPSSGMGLQVMNHRANVIGATFEAKSQPGQGVTIACTVPLNPS